MVHMNFERRRIVLLKRLPTASKQPPGHFSLAEQSLPGPHSIPDRSLALFVDPRVQNPQEYVHEMVN